MDGREEVRRLLELKLRIKETSQFIEYKNVINTYTKGGFFCIYLKGETVVKWPMGNIHMLEQTYGPHSSKGDE